MNKKLDFKTFKEKALEDTEVKAEYELLRPEFELMMKLIKARKKSCCSQLELADRLKLQQPAIARLERGGYTTTSVGKLARVADALGYSLKVSLSPKRSDSRTKLKK